MTVRMVFSDVKVISPGVGDLYSVRSCWEFGVLEGVSEDWGRSRGCFSGPNPGSAYTYSHQG